MNKKFTKLIAALALLLCMTPPLWVMGQTRTNPVYIFTNSSWNATLNNEAANWYSVDNGDGYNSDRGVQTTNDNTSCANCPTSYSNITKVTVTYCTNASSGAGTIKVFATTQQGGAQSGTQIGSNFSVTKPSSGGATLKTHDFTPSSPITGFVQVYVNASASSVYIYSVEVTYSSGNFITVSPTTKNVTCAAQNVEFNIATNQTLEANPVVFYTTSEGTTSTSKPSWIGDLASAYSSNTLTIPVTANTGAAHTAYFRVEKGTVQSDVVTLTQAEYTVTPPTLTAAANFDANKDVTITPASGTTVYYTTDNSTPSNNNGTAITAATTFNIKATTTVKAIAYDNNNIASTEVSATYTKSTNNISNITSAAQYNIVGTVVATSAKGFILGDGTGYVYCYRSNGSNIHSIDSKVKINANVTTWNHVYEYSSAYGTAGQSASNYEGGTATPIGGTDIDGYTSGNHLSDYVQIEGVLTKSGSNYDIAIAGYDSHVVRVSNPTPKQGNDLTELNNHKVRIKGYFTGFASTADDAPFTIMFDNVEDIQPVVTASETELSGFTYNYSYGPSANQNFTVSGEKLIGNLTVTASSNYEVCLTENGDYVSSVSLSPANGVVDNTTVYVRLKSGLSSGLYNSNDDKITVASTDAVTKTVALSGSVTHAITTGAHENGSLEVATAAAYNTTVSVTAAPASEYFRLSALTVTKASDGSAAGVTPSLVSGNEYSFTMPDFDITVSATYVPLYDITITNTTGGTVTAVEKAAEGEVVSINISANSTPAPGFALNTLVVTKDSDESSIEVENDEFTMPAGNVTITASFIALRSMAYDKNGASVTGTAPVDAQSPYRDGAEVTVLAKGELALEGYDFSGWNSAANGSGNSGTNYAAGDQFTITENTTLYAQWTAIDYSIAKSEMSNGSVTVKIGDHVVTTGNINQTVTLEVTPAANHKLSTLTVMKSGDIAVDLTPTVSSSVLTYTFTMPADDVTVSATFAEASNVTFMVNGVVKETRIVDWGEELGTLPTITNAEKPTGFIFNCWTPESEYFNATTAPTQQITAETVPEGDVTYAAVFCVSTPGDDHWNLTNTAPANNNEIILAALDNDGYYYAMEGPYREQLSVSGGAITGTAPSSARFTVNVVTQNNNTDTYLKQGNNYLHINSSELKVTVSTTNGSVVFTAQNGGGFIVARKDNARWIKYTGSGFTSTSSSSEASTLYLFKNNPDAPTLSNFTTIVTDNSINEDVNGIVRIFRPISATASFTNNGTIIIYDGGVLNMGNNTLTNTTAANLIIEDGGQLIHNNEVQATLQKNITKASNWGAQNPESPYVPDGWYFIASPIVDASVDVATIGTYDLFYYNEAAGQWYNQKKHNGFTNFTEGWGYLYATNNTDGQTLSFAGSMKATNAKVTVPMSFEGPDVNIRGFNLVGNPFTRNLVSGEVELNGQAITTYYTIEGGTNLVSTAIDTDPIKPGQGFLVQANGEEQNLVFNPTTRGGKAEEPAFISIEAGNDSFMDRAYVQIGGGNTLRKMTLNDNTAKVYVMNDGKDYAAATIEAAQGEMPVNFKAAENGYYTITVNAKGVETNYLHLIDNMTGADVDLLQIPSYSFEAKTSDFESRFRLVFAANNEDGVSTGSTTFAFISNGNIIVNGEGTLQVIDVTGRLLFTREVNSSLNTPHSSLTPGVYVMRLINGDNVRTQKIVIE